MLLRLLLDILFPRSSSSIRYDNLTSLEFLRQAKLCTNPPDPASDISLESIFEYRDRFVHDAIWELKYHGNRHIAKIFAEILYDHIRDMLADSALFLPNTKPILIPIPSSHKRRRERGWNQTELIARELERLDTQKFFVVRTDILEKRIHTAPQTKLSRSKRLTNLHDAFVVSSRKIPDIHKASIILIDDVVTTGSTLNEAAKILKNAGVHDIYGLTVAH